jgi:hypothetical protein
LARQGLGGALVVDALTRALRAEPAVYALVVEAKDDAARPRRVDSACEPATPFRKITHA